MAKKRQENPSDESPSSKPATTKPTKAKPVKKRAAGELPWHPFWRWLVSLLVVVHLTAVFSAPWNLQTPQEVLPPGSGPLRLIPPEKLQNIPPEDIQTPLITNKLHRSFFNDYLNLLYLNHGYEFFAPDPSNTRVIDYQVTKADGAVVEGRLPSHDEHWPRLLYHRHMMLAEQTQIPVMGPASGQNYANHLATLHDGMSSLQLKIHLLQPAYLVANKAPLDDPSTFRLLDTVNGSPRVKRIDTEMPAPTQGAQQ